MLEMAQALVPTLGNAPFEGAWAGLRPGTPDNLPIVGSLSGWENAYVAAGHFRNGVLLAPITAEIVVGELRGGQAHALAAPLRADRFAAERRRRTKVD